MLTCIVRPVINKKFINFDTTEFTKLSEALPGVVIELELDVNLKNKYLNIRSGLDVLKENIELDNADVEKIVDRYIKLKQKASKLIESNKELLEQVKDITNKYTEREKHFKKNGYIFIVKK